MVAVIICVAGWIVGWLLFGAPRTVASLRGDDVPTAFRSGSVPVDVVIPARDEADNIGGLLAQLTGVAADGGRVLVVDDHSQDATPRLAAAVRGVELVQASALPDGWTGKNWACHSGVEHLLAVATHGSDALSPIGSDGDPQPLVEVDGFSCLVFLDADVRVGPGTLQVLARHQQAGGGLVSVQPWHRTERPYEQLSALFNVIAVMGTGMGSRRSARGAFGPLLVTSFADYEQAGGHDGVHGEVAEDLALSQRYRAAGLPVELFAGGDDVQFRMYPDGLRQLIEGWTKNFATGAGATSALRLLGVVLWIAALGSAVAATVDSALGVTTFWVGPALFVLMVTQLWVMFRRVGRFGVLTAVLYPVVLVFFLGVFVRSLWLTHVRRRVSWRGRSIPVAGGRA